MHRKQRNQTTARRHAFSLLEMLVAVSTTVLLVLFVNEIFSSMGQAVGLGIANSTIIENSRIITEQIEQDADKMVSPRDNGILVIGFERVGIRDTGGSFVSGPFLHAESEFPVGDPVGSDQVLWIRETDRGEEPLSPYNEATFENVTRAQYSRIWYGHGMRTDPDGNGPDPSGLGFPGGPNEFASKFMLARHNLFLDEHADDPAYRPGGWYLENGTSTSPLRVMGASVTVPQLIASPLQNFHGLCDIASIGLVGNTPTDGIVSNGPRPAMGAADDLLYLNDFAGDSGIGYSRSARRYLFSFGRLRVLESIDDLTSQTLPSGDGFLAWQIARLHAVLAKGAVDFRVQFAGDYLEGVGIDGEPDSVPVDTDGDGVNDSFETIWYDNEKIQELLQTTPAIVPFPFAIEGVDTTDPTRPIYAANPSTSLVGQITFRHGDPDQVNWPYMLRFQYRLIDENARLTGSDDGPGRLFELIVPVARD